MYSAITIKRLAPTQKVKCRALGTLSKPIVLFVKADILVL